MSTVDTSLIKKPHLNEKYTKEQLLEVAKCFNDPIYFANNHCFIQHPVKGKVPFALFDYQERLITTYHNYRHVVAMMPRQCGKTTCAASYLLWYAMFHEDSTILIAAHKRDGASEIMQRVRFMYESLSDYIRAGIVSYNRGSIEFDQGSRIISTATTETTGRGMSITLLYVDEMSYIRNNVVESFWGSLGPTIAEGGRVIITSTPDQEHHLFARLVKDADRTIDEFGNQTDVGVNGFKYFTALWNEHPDRDDDWAKEQLAKLGEERFRREFLCVSGNSRINLNDHDHITQTSIENLYNSL